MCAEGHLSPLDTFGSAHVEISQFVTSYSDTFGFAKRLSAFLKIKFLNLTF